MFYVELFMCTHTHTQFDKQKACNLFLILISRELYASICYFELRFHF